MSGIMATIEIHNAATGETTIHTHDGLASLRHRLDEAMRQVAALPRRRIVEATGSSVAVAFHDEGQTARLDEPDWLWVFGFDGWKRETR